MGKKLTKKLLIAGGIGVGVGFLYIIINSVLSRLNIYQPNFYKIHYYTIGLPLFTASEILLASGCNNYGCILLSLLVSLVFYFILGILVYYIYTKVRK